MLSAYKTLCNGASLPIDDKDVAMTVLNDLKKQLNERHILYDISDLSLTTPVEINIARRRLEDILARTNEIEYAKAQCDQWQEISDYMTLLIKGKDKNQYIGDRKLG